jgi:hypothetical protein
MGMSIGGIAAPEPRKMWAWQGDATAASGTEVVKTLTVAGMSGYFRIKAQGLSVNAGGATCDFTLIVVAGSEYTLFTAHYTSVNKMLLDSIGTHDTQMTTITATGVDNFTTHAFAMADITGIKFKATPAAGCVGHIYQLTCEQLDAI